MYYIEISTLLPPIEGDTCGVRHSTCQKHFNTSPSHGWRCSIRLVAAANPYFNTSPSRGGRPVISNIPSVPNFNTSPFRGGRHFQRVLNYFWQNFNTSPSYGGRPDHWLQQGPFLHFNTSPSHGGRLDPACGSGNFLTDFNTSPSYRGRRLILCFPMVYFPISTPLPPMEGDRNEHRRRLHDRISTLLPHVDGNANSAGPISTLLPPVEGDDSRNLRKSSISHFNTSPSHGGRPHSVETQHRFYHFNTSPSYEGRPRGSSGWGLLEDFNTSPSHGGRPKE